MRGRGLSHAARRVREKLLDLCDHCLRLERFREKAFTPCSLGALLIERLERSGQKQYRYLLQVVVGLDELANFVPVLLRHNDIAENDVRSDGTNLVYGLLPVSNSMELEILVGKC